jgi:hypothetical protein
MLGINDIKFCDEEDEAVAFATKQFFEYIESVPLFYDDDDIFSEYLSEHNLMSSNNTNNVNSLHTPEKSADMKLNNPNRCVEKKTRSIRTTNVPTMSSMPQFDTKFYYNNLIFNEYLREGASLSMNDVCNNKPQLPSQAINSVLDKLKKIAFVDVK